MMKALIWCAPYKVAVERVPEPKILNKRDAIVRLTSTAVCGSDLHLVDGFVPFMKPGDIIGHEPMGIVEEVGPGVDGSKLKVGDKVIVPFPIGCGECFFCRRDLWSCCDNTNAKPYIGENMFGFATAGMFGYSALTGGYAGAQAELLRVPLADVNCQVIPADMRDMDDHKLLFLSDILPTGWMAAKHCDIKPDDTVAVWGCGPVGQFTIRSAMVLGAGRVVAIDSVPERLRMAADAGAITIDNRSEDVYDRLLDLTGGIGPDVCIDAVGMEAHGTNAIEHAYDKAKTWVFGESERPAVIRQCIECCRKAGTVSIPGVYGGVSDKIPIGALMNKGLTIKTGQTHVHAFVPELLDVIRTGKIDPSFVVTHRMPLSQAPEAYHLFREKKDGCIKVVLDPAA